MKTALATCLALLLCFSGRSAALAGRPDSTVPYLGQWSNGRGETLAITNSTIRFADNRPVPYRDLTRATDNTVFELQITAPGRVNAFDGKFLFISCEGAQMKITTYSSHAELAQERNSGSEVTWFREDAEAGDDDGEDE